MQKNQRLSSIIDHLLRQPKRYVAARLAVGELISFSDELIHAQWNDSPLAHISLSIRRVPALHQCMACFEKYNPIQTRVSCPHCGGVGAKILTGEEFYLELIEEKYE